MEFSVGFAGVPAEQVAVLARRCEDLGFGLIWSSNNHLAIPLGARTRHTWVGAADDVLPATSLLYDPWALLSYVAAHTSRVRLASSVTVLAMHDPLAIARAVASLQWLSQGRAMLGVGAGWFAEEFAAAGVDFHTRGARTDESLELLRKLWSGQTVTHHGRYRSLGPLTFGQTPSRIPIVIGGLSRSAMRRASRSGDGWTITGRWTLEECVKARSEMRSLLVDAGRAGEPFDYYVPLNGPQDRANVRRYAGEGFTHLRIAAPTHWREPGGDRPLAEKLATLERIAETLGVGG